MRRTVVTETEEIKCDICGKDTEENCIVQIKGNEEIRNVSTHFINSFLLSDIVICNKCFGPAKELYIKQTKEKADLIEMLKNGN